MKHTKTLAILMVVLLSVSIAGVSFAEEPADEVILEQTEFIVEATPVVVATATQEPAISQAPAVTPKTDADPTPQAQQEPAITEEPTQEPTHTPETNPTATQSADPTQTPAPTQGATQEPAAEQPINRSVSIRMDKPAHLSLGDTVTLIATLSGYEGSNVALQWQYTFDGEHWFDADGANALTYTFTVAENTAGTGWRLAVSVL